MSKIYASSGRQPQMQRCPYIHEMRERFINETPRQVQMMRRIDRERDIAEREGLINPRQSSAVSDASINQVGTVVKLNADGYGLHTSPAHTNLRTPLVPRDLGEDFSIGYDDDQPGNAIQLDPRIPKNANTSQYGLFVQPNKRTSLFIITSLVYAMLLIVVCIAYVISDVSTHRLPAVYYEGYFTYLYGASILFLLYVFCFLLQESTCCSGGSSAPKPPKPVHEKKEKPKKEKKPKKGEEGPAGAAPDAKDKDSKASGKDKEKEKDAAKGAKPVPFQKESIPLKQREVVRMRSTSIEVVEQDSAPEAEITVSTPKNIRKRKTTHNDPSYGSFFLRVGAIAFGLGTLIYVGLELGSFFEIPFTSPCHQILRGVNPLLQMIFTFMQMYFIFMNARLNIHRFKVVARFGLMHICATNICVWIRTLVLESLKELTLHYQTRQSHNDEGILHDSIRQHTLKHSGVILGTHSGPQPEWEPIDLRVRDNMDNRNDFGKFIDSSVRSASKAVQRSADYLAGTAPTTTHEPTQNPFETTTMIRKLKKFISSSTEAVATTLASSTTTTQSTSTTPLPTTSTPLSSTLHDMIPKSPSSAQALITDAITTTTTAAPSSTVESVFNNFFAGVENAYQTMSGLSHNETGAGEPKFEELDALFPQALTATLEPSKNSSCGRVNIMGTIVQDSAPYLYPFIVEYSLIGAVVIYVMWKHIGRYAKNNEEDLEHRLEVMLSRRAVAMAQRARSGRVDCVGASKGLFFGLLALVGSLICLILFFVLIVKPPFNRLAIFLADCSHCAVLCLSILAILIGFCRVQKLKFRCEQQGNLNDILLRISAFGVFVYSAFSIIAGALNASTSEPNLLVCITGSIVVLQVVLQLLFIADVSRRRVHLPEHDRTKPARQVVTFLLIANVAMFAIYTFDAQKVANNPVQRDFYGYVGWALIQRVTLPLCIFHRFHSAVTLAEIWKTTYKPRLE